MTCFLHSEIVCYMNYTVLHELTRLYSKRSVACAQKSPVVSTHSVQNVQRPSPNLHPHVWSRLGESGWSLSLAQDVDSVELVRRWLIKQRKVQE